METVWIGNLVRVGSNTPRYLYHEEENFIDFRTLKDKKELGYLDKRINVVYFNRDYEKRFNNVKKQIIKDYAIKKENIGEYISLGDDF